MTNDNQRRRALRALAGFFAASPLARAQFDLPDPKERIPSLDDLVNVFEFEPVCKLRVPKQSYDFMAGGVDNEWSLRHNREAFDKITFRPRMLVNASNLDLSTTLLGARIDFPVLIAPTAGHGQFNEEGELATARAAAAMQTLIVLSTNSSQPYEKVAESTSAAKWFQLYPGPDLDGTWERVARAKAAGFKAIVLTVDAGYNSHRERLLRNRIRAQVPPGVNSPQTARRRRQEDDTDKQPVSQPAYYGLSTTLMHQLDWSFYDELKKRAGMPVLIKGILTPEDTALAVQRGADAVVISNHGGRYLDYAPATIEVLKDCVDAAGRMPVLVDSGFRRGSDILKALAIGARAVLVGRPALWGLGAYGEPGVKRVLEMLRTELALAMGLCGRPNLASLDRSILKLPKD